ncbi:MAG: hypothetical protein AB8G22_06220 [Saprospiraceae bacterium]
MEIGWKEFQQNLKLTQTYCDNQLNNQLKSTARTLRSINLSYHKTRYFEFRWEEEFKLELVRWNTKVLDENFGSIESIFIDQLDYKKEKVNVENHKFNGNILVSEFESTVIDGVSEVESEGLIDIFDLPPIDTWFHLVEKNGRMNMFAWVPKKFYSQAVKAVEVNCLDLLYWF